MAKLFVKIFTSVAGARYPDLGSSVTVFINDQSLELETMAPLSLLPAGKSVEYTEQWSLFNDVPDPKNEEEIDALIASRVEEARKAWKRFPLPPPRQEKGNPGDQGIIEHA